MNEQEILSNLCAYDQRNPNKIEGQKLHKGPCYCDNCFYGRTKMAEYILELRQSISQWWEVNQYQTTSNGEDEINIFDQEPDFVKMART